MANRTFIFKSPAVIIILSLILSACSSGNPQVTTQPDQTAAPAASPTPQPEQALVRFTANLAEGIRGGNLFLEILDPLASAESVAARHELTEQADGSYAVEIPIVVGSLVEYRFARGESRARLETTCSGGIVSPRVFRVSGSDISNNIICGFGDEAFKGQSGRISGSVTDAKTGDPLADVLVEAGGVRSLTAADGNYLIEGLAPGTHVLVARSLDGEYEIFQQGAVVASRANTPAPLEISPVKWVEVTFSVSAPASELPNQPIRLIGNTHSLGSTFQYQTGELAATRAPFLEHTQDDAYTITLKLPAGHDLRYRFTLGNNLWNSERSDEGDLITRQLIVPAKNIRIQAQIATWQATDVAPVTFQVKTPGTTPSSDLVSIQFTNNGMWTDPLTMWPLGGGQWYYILYSPAGGETQLRYRYCRNEQCGAADDARSIGPEAKGFELSISAEPQIITEAIQDWAGLGQSVPTVLEESVSTKLREGLFIGGVELQSGSTVAWQPYLNQTMQDIQAINAAWVVLTPGWVVSSQNPPVLTPTLGYTPLQSEQQQSVALVRASGLHAALYPQMQLSGDFLTWWQDAARDADWWQRWFEQYRKFALHYAAWAQKMEVEMLILGGPAVAPALPGFEFANNAGTGLPGDAAERWRALLGEVRAAYNGQIVWAIQYPDGLKNAPEWLDSVDQIYLLWSAGLTKEESPTEKALAAQVTRLLKEDVLPVQKKFNKPILLGVAYPSAKGALLGCVKVGNACASVDELNVTDLLADADYDQQKLAYRAVMKVISRPDHTWVSGLISRGYYPPAVLADRSNSIHGKPVEDVISAWFAALR